MRTFLIIHPDKPDHEDVVCGDSAWPEFERLGWVRKPDQDEKQTDQTDQTAKPKKAK